MKEHFLGNVSRVFATACTVELAYGNSVGVSSFSWYKTGYIVFLFWPCPYRSTWLKYSIAHLFSMASIRDSLQPIPSNRSHYPVPFTGILDARRCAGASQSSRPYHGYIVWHLPAPYKAEEQRFQVNTARVVALEWGRRVPGSEGRRSQQDEGLPFARPRTVASSAVSQLLGLVKRVSDNILYN